MTEDIKLGWYSAQAVADGCSTVFWSTPDGGEVEICSVGTADSFVWKDRVCVGPVVAYIRPGKSDTRFRERFQDETPELTRKWRRW